jgi:hypothetical protein
MSGHVYAYDVWRTRTRMLSCDLRRCARALCVARMLGLMMCVPPHFLSAKIAASAFVACIHTCRVTSSIRKLYACL